MSYTADNLFFSFESGLKANKQKLKQFITFLVDISIETSTFLIQASKKLNNKDYLALKYKKSAFDQFFKMLEMTKKNIRTDLKKSVLLITNPIRTSKLPEFEKTDILKKLHRLWKSGLDDDYRVTTNRREKLYDLLSIIEGEVDYQNLSSRTNRDVPTNIKQLMSIQTESDPQQPLSGLTKLRNERMVKEKENFRKTNLLHMDTTRDENYASQTEQVCSYKYSKTSNRFSLRRNGINNELNFSRISGFRDPFKGNSPIQDASERKPGALMEIPETSDRVFLNNFENRAENHFEQEIKIQGVNGHETEQESLLKSYDTEDLKELKAANLSNFIRRNMHKESIKTEFLDCQEDHEDYIVVEERISTSISSSNGKQNLVNSVQKKRVRIRSQSSQTKPKPRDVLNREDQYSPSPSPSPSRKASLKQEILASKGSLIQKTDQGASEALSGSQQEATILYVNYSKRKRSRKSRRSASKSKRSKSRKKGKKRKRSSKMSSAKKRQSIHKQDSYGIALYDEQDENSLTSSYSTSLINTDEKKTTGSHGTSSGLPLPSKQAPQLTIQQTKPIEIRVLVEASHTQAESETLQQESSTTNQLTQDIVSPILSVNNVNLNSDSFTDPNESSIRSLVFNHICSKKSLAGVVSGGLELQNSSNLAFALDGELIREFSKKQLIQMNYMESGGGEEDRFGSNQVLPDNINGTLKEEDLGALEKQRLRQMIKQSTPSVVTKNSGPIVISNAADGPNLAQIGGNLNNAGMANGRDLRGGERPKPTQKVIQGAGKADVQLGVVGVMPISISPNITNRSRSSNQNAQNHNGTLVSDRSVFRNSYMLSTQSNESRNPGFGGQNQTPQTGQLKEINNSFGGSGNQKSPERQPNHALNQNNGHTGQLSPSFGMGVQKAINVNNSPGSQQEGWGRTQDKHLTNKNFDMVSQVNIISRNLSTTKKPISTPQNQKNGQNRALTYPNAVNNLRNGPIGPTPQPKMVNSSIEYLQQESTANHSKSASEQQNHTQSGSNNPQTVISSISNKNSKNPYESDEMSLPSFGFANTPFNESEQLSQSSKILFDETFQRSSTDAQKLDQDKLGAQIGQLGGQEGPVGLSPLLFNQSFQASNYSKSKTLLDSFGDPSSLKPPQVESQIVEEANIFGGPKNDSNSQAVAKLLPNDSFGLQMGAGGQNGLDVLQNGSFMDSNMLGTEESNAPYFVPPATNTGQEGKQSPNQHAAGSGVASGSGKKGLFHSGSQGGGGKQRASSEVENVKISELTFKSRESDGKDELLGINEALPPVNPYVEIQTKKFFSGFIVEEHELFERSDRLSVSVSPKAELIYIAGDEVHMFKHSLNMYQQFGKLALPKKLSGKLRNYVKVYSNTSFIIRDSKNNHYSLMTQKGQMIKEIKGETYPELQDATLPILHCNSGSTMLPWRKTATSLGIIDTKDFKLVKEIESFWTYKNNTNLKEKLVICDNIASNIIAVSELEDGSKIFHHYTKKKNIVNARLDQLLPDLNEWFCAEICDSQEEFLVVGSSSVKKSIGTLFAVFAITVPIKIVAAIKVPDVAEVNRMQRVEGTDVFLIACNKDLVVARYYPKRAKAKLELVTRLRNISETRISDFCFRNLYCFVVPSSSNRLMILNFQEIKEGKTAPKKSEKRDKEQRKVSGGEEVGKGSKGAMAGAGGGSGAPGTLELRNGSSSESGAVSSPQVGKRSRKKRSYMSGKKSKPRESVDSTTAGNTTHHSRGSTASISNADKVTQGAGTAGEAGNSGDKRADIVLKSKRRSRRVVKTEIQFSSPAVTKATNGSANTVQEVPQQGEGESGVKGKQEVTVGAQPKAEASRQVNQVAGAQNQAPAPKKFDLREGGVDGQNLSHNQKMGQNLNQVLNSGLQGAPPQRQDAQINRRPPQAPVELKPLQVPQNPGIMPQDPHSNSNTSRSVVNDQEMHQKVQIQKLLSQNISGLTKPPKSEQPLLQSKTSTSKASSGPQVMQDSGPTNSENTPISNSSQSEIRVGIHLSEGEMSNNSHMNPTPLLSHENTLMMNRRHNPPSSHQTESKEPSVTNTRPSKPPLACESHQTSSQKSGLPPQNSNKNVMKNSTNTNNNNSRERLMQQKQQNQLKQGNLNLNKNSNSSENSVGSRTDGSKKRASRPRRNIQRVKVSTSFEQHDPTKSPSSGTNLHLSSSFSRNQLLESGKLDESIQFNKLSNDFLQGDQKPPGGMASSGGPPLASKHQKDFNVDNESNSAPDSVNQSFLHKQQSVKSTPAKEQSGNPYRQPSQFGGVSVAKFGASSTQGNFPYTTNNTQKQRAFSRADQEELNLKFKKKIQKMNLLDKDEDQPSMSEDLTLFNDQTSLSQASESERVEAVKETGNNIMELKQREILAKNSGRANTEMWNRGGPGTSNRNSEAVSEGIRSMNSLKGVSDTERMIQGNHTGRISQLSSSGRFDLSSQRVDASTQRMLTEGIREHEINSQSIIMANNEQSGENSSRLEFINPSTANKRNEPSDPNQDVKGIRFNERRTSSQSNYSTDRFNQKQGDSRSLASVNGIASTYKKRESLSHTAVVVDSSGRKQLEGERADQITLKRNKHEGEVESQNPTTTVRASRKNSSSLVEPPASEIQNAQGRKSQEPHPENNHSTTGSKESSVQKNRRRLHKTKVQIQIPKPKNKSQGAADGGAHRPSTGKSRASEGAGMVDKLITSIVDLDEPQRASTGSFNNASVGGELSHQTSNQQSLHSVSLSTIMSHNSSYARPGGLRSSVKLRHKRSKKITEIGIPQEMNSILNRICVSENEKYIYVGGKNLHFLKKIKSRKTKKVSYALLSNKIIECSFYHIIATPSSHFLIFENQTNDVILYDKTFSEVTRFKGKPDQGLLPTEGSLECRRSYCNKITGDVIWISSQSELKLIKMSDLSLQDISLFDDEFVQRMDPFILHVMYTSSKEILMVCFLHDHLALVYQKTGSFQTDIIILEEVAPQFKFVGDCELSSDESIFLIAGSTTLIDDVKLKQDGNAVISAIKVSQKMEEIACKDFGPQYGACFVIKKPEYSRNYMLGCYTGILEVEFTGTEFNLISVVKLGRMDIIIDFYVCKGNRKEIYYLTKKAPSKIRNLRFLDQSSSEREGVVEQDGNDEEGFGKLSSGQGA